MRSTNTFLRLVSLFTFNTGQRILQGPTQTITRVITVTLIQKFRTDGTTFVGTGTTESRVVAEVRVETLGTWVGTPR